MEDMLASTQLPINIGLPIHSCLSLDLIRQSFLVMELLNLGKNDSLGQ